MGFPITKRAKVMSDKKKQSTDTEGELTPTFLVVLFLGCFWAAIAAMVAWLW